MLVSEEGGPPKHPWYVDAPVHPCRDASAALSMTSASSGGQTIGDRDLDAALGERQAVVRADAAVGDQPVDPLQRRDFDQRLDADLAVIGQHDNFAGGLQDGLFDGGLGDVGVGQAKAKADAGDSQEGSVGP